MNKSESVSKLAVALVKFNSEIGKVSKDASNPFFKNKYATLDNIIDEARPILTKNGLSIIQIPSGDGVNVIIKTLLLHESGEWIETEDLIMKPVKNDPQAIGSCLTYMRRYSLTSFLSLNTGEDDDGHKATEPQGKPVSNYKAQTSNPTTKTETKPKQAVDEQKAQVNSSDGLISDKQRTRMFSIAGKGNEETIRMILTSHGYESSKAIQTKDYESICNEITKAVTASKGA